MKYLLGLASGLSSMFCILIGYAIAEQANASSLLTTVLMSAAAGRPRRRLLPPPLLVIVQMRAEILYNGYARLYYGSRGCA